MWRLQKETDNGQEREVRVLKAALSRCWTMMLLTVQERVAAKATVCDLQLRSACYWLEYVALGHMPHNFHKMC